MSSHNSGGHAHGSVKEYLVGLFLSLMLTFVPFGLVVYSDMSSSLIMLVIIVCAIAQLLVQGVFFLHMTGSSEETWETSSALYIIFTILAFIIGTIWIFNHLSHNMLMGH